MKAKIAVFLTIITAFVAGKSTATTCEGKPPKVKTASGVVLLHGKPLAGVSVELIRKGAADGASEGSIVTGEDGHFFVPVRKKGLHRMKVTWPKMYPAISSADSSFAEINVRSSGTPKTIKYEMVINLGAGCGAWLERKRK
jgi:hypothetical protein